jgi:hypothetical protein
MRVMRSRHFLPITALRPSCSSTGWRASRVPAIRSRATSWRMFSVRSVWCAAARQDWQLDPRRIGVIGFSAGGELAALSGAHYDDGAAQAADPIERVSSRPGFQALLYPSIPQGMTPSADTPPAFLLCGAADGPDDLAGPGAAVSGAATRGGARGTAHLRRRRPRFRHPPRHRRAGRRVAAAPARVAAAAGTRGPTLNRATVRTWR